MPSVMWRFINSELSSSGRGPTQSKPSNRCIVDQPPTANCHRPATQGGMHGNPCCTLLGSLGLTEFQVLGVQVTVSSRS